MKKLIVAGVMALGVFSASAQKQDRLYQPLMNSSALCREAEKPIQNWKNTRFLQQQGQDMMKELGDKDSVCKRFS